MPDWEYYNKVKGMTESRNKVGFKWGDEATPQDKALLKRNIRSLTKWKREVKRVLESPPMDTEAEVIELRARVDALEGGGG